MMAYIGWLLVSAVFYGFGIYAWTADKPVSFWNFTQQIQVNHVEKYNQAVAKLWISFAVLFDIIGLPVLAGQNSAWIVFLVLGTMAWAIALMAVYTGIEKKYRI